MSKCLGNLSVERQMQVLHSRYVQAIMREENLNASQAIEALNRQLVPAGRGDTPSQSVAPCSPAPTGQSPTGRVR